MATEILACVINSLGSWTNVGGANATISVAKPDDEDTSYITIAAGLDTTCLFDVADTAIPGGSTINSVLVRARLRSTIGTDSSGAVDMSDNAFTNTVTSSPLITNSYADFVGTTSVTKPSGGAWTIAALNTLQVRVKGWDVSVARLTSLTVEVAWTAASGGANPGGSETWKNGYQNKFSMEFIDGFSEPDL